MKTSSSSKKWLNRSSKDAYSLLARKENYRSRAAYKILEIDEKFKIFKGVKSLIDLGAAPGSWSQVASKLTKPYTSIVSVDLLAFDQIEKVTQLQCDFLSNRDLIARNLPPTGVELVLSDMAPNTTGVKSVDVIRIIDLCENALNFSLEFLNTGGHFICKVFQGGLESKLYSQIKHNFNNVKYFKPQASYKDSKEIYLIALDKKCTKKS
jgi:23S rRNA (uridine2552-2'-O)-methyltransferase